MNNKVLLVRPQSLPVEQVLEPFAGRLPGSYTLFEMTNASYELDLTAADRAPAHIFARGDISFDAVCVHGRTPVLFATNFCVAWLCGLLDQTTDGGQVLVYLPPSKQREDSELLTSRTLSGILDAACFEDFGSGLLRLHNNARDAGRRLPTSYTALADEFEAFGKKIEEHRVFDRQQPDDWAALKRRQFIYGLFGACQKNYALQRIFAATGLRNRPLRVLDMGGGFGFVALELAHQGHDVHVVDSDSPRTECVGPWLREVCRPAATVTFETLRMEDIGCISGQFDVVSFFGALLYADRAIVPDILARAGDRLRPGGLVVLHELSKATSTPQMPDHEKKFDPDELFSFVEKNVGPFDCFNVFSGDVIDRESAKRQTMLIAARATHEPK